MTSLETIINVASIDANSITCKPSSLRGHIVNEHLNPTALFFSGVPIWDIGLAAYRGIDLGWVVKKIYGKLEQGDTSIKAELAAHNLHYDPDEYREMLVKTLLYIQQLHTAEVDWERVHASYSLAPNVHLNIEEDLYMDEPFNPNDLKYSGETK